MPATTAAKTLSGSIISILVEDIETMKQSIEAYGGKHHPGPTGHASANAEHKFRDPNGIVFDISTHGWDGARD